MASDPAKRVAIRIPPVTHDWLKRRYSVFQPKATAAHVEVPPPEVISNRTKRPIKRGIVIFGKSYNSDTIVHCLQNPHVLPDEIPKEVMLTYQDIYENYYLENDILIDRTTRMEVTQKLLWPVIGKESTTPKEVKKILLQKGLSEERLAYIESLEKRVETLEKEIINFKLKLLDIGLEL